MSRGQDARSYAKMSLRANPRPNYGAMEDGCENVLDRFVWIESSPGTSAGEGCAWRNPRGRYAKQDQRFLERSKSKRKKSSLEDVYWKVRHGGTMIELGMHVIGRAKSTNGVSSRSLRRGVQVAKGKRFHAYIPKGTWLPGGLFGLEYTKEEEAKLSETCSEDKNVMWVLKHSTVQIPPRLRCERHLPNDNVIIPDLKHSGLVILINNGSNPNCEMLAEWHQKTKVGRWVWAVYFKTTRDVYQGEELISEYVPSTNTASNK